MPARSFGCPHPNPPIQQQQQQQQRLPKMPSLPAAVLLLLLLLIVVLPLVLLLQPLPKPRVAIAPLITSLTSYRNAPRIQEEVSSAIAEGYLLANKVVEVGRIVNLSARCPRLLHSFCRRICAPMRPPLL
jgi:hypothetical protein